MEVVLFDFFFSSRRRHTRYIGDWSSDVCSSDLGSGDIGGSARHGIVADGNDVKGLGGGNTGDAITVSQSVGLVIRSEERRVGKECRSRWWGERLKRKVRNGREMVK